MQQSSLVQRSEICPHTILLTVAAACELCQVQEDQNKMFP